MRVPVFLVGLLGAALAPELSLADDQGVKNCAAPPELIEDAPRLPLLAQELGRHQPIVIVAIGGASTEGAGPDDSYPHFLEAALQRRHPGESIRVINRGVAGETTEEMAARFPKDVYAEKPNLVLWETGTVDSVRGEDVDAVATSLSDGLDDIKTHGAEAMLMDMQYNRSTVSVINFGPYLDALHQTAQLQGVYMFKRFDLMKYWIEAGRFDFINVPKINRTTLARELYACLGERLAEAIDDAAH